MSEAEAPFDAIVVLGAALLPGGRPSPLLRGRLAEGLRLLDAGRAPLLVLSGGRGNGAPAEAEVMAGLARAAGVAEARLLCETESATTLENALYSARCLRARGASRVLVVTDRLHLPRALMAFRAAGLSCRGAPVAGAWRRVGPRRALRELAALLYYAALLACGRHRAKARRLRD